MVVLNSQQVFSVHRLNDVVESYLKEIPQIPQKPSSRMSFFVTIINEHMTAIQDNQDEMRSLEEAIGNAVRPEDERRILSDRLSGLFMDTVAREAVVAVLSRRLSMAGSRLSKALAWSFSEYKFESNPNFSNLREEVNNG